MDRLQQLRRELRSLRTDEVGDPFELYQQGMVSKGWLIGQISEAVAKIISEVVKPCD